MNLIPRKGTPDKALSDTLSRSMKREQSKVKKVAAEYGRDSPEYKAAVAAAANAILTDLKRKL